MPRLVSRSAAAFRRRALVPALRRTGAVCCAAVGEGAVGTPGQWFQFDALMRVSHDRAPGHAGQRAAGHAVGRRVIVVAHPDAADEVAGIADEPGVAPRIGGAGLAGGLDAGDHGAAAGAFFHRLVEHHVDVARRPAGASTRRGFGPSRSKRQISSPLGAAHFQDGMRGDRHAVIGEGGEGAGMVEHGDFGGADRQRWRVGQRACAGPCRARSAMILARPAFGLPLPSMIESFTGMVLIDLTSAMCSVVEPEKPPE